MQNGRTAPSSAPIANLSVNTLAGRKLMDNQYYNFLAIAATTKLRIEPVIPLALKPEKIKSPTGPPITFKTISENNPHLAFTILLTTNPVVRPIIMIGISTVCGSSPL